MTLVAAIDTTEKATAVLTETIGLADDLGEDMHVLHVLTRNELVEILNVDVNGIDVTENARVQEHIDELIERRAPEPGMTFKAVARVGDPAAEIVRYADEVEARYVVIAGEKRSPTGKALFGSVGQSVLLQSRMPVINVPTNQD
ncbi:universal stress protein [Saliphagus sp. LR7]|uniref:universal stress protein n=1 Tax=Saliphagus sp. LR7 TaxID=2282654 RepID=UPI000DF8409A|nr:universal stress protein [Saliphagus sp. LR7]